MANNINQRVNAFLAECQETKISTNRARIDLARKINERGKLIQRRRKMKERVKKMIKNLKTVEAQVEITNIDIQNLELAVDNGSDDEDN
jgi:seryl-tRNA synthetase